jgi:hypothetical protein
MGSACQQKGWARQLKAGAGELMCCKDLLGTELRVDARALSCTSTEEVFAPEQHIKVQARSQAEGKVADCIDRYDLLYRAAAFTHGVYITFTGCIGRALRPPGIVPWRLRTFL